MAEEPHNGGEDVSRPLRIVRLEAEAFKRLSAVEIVPDGTLVRITGKNGAGKSSVIDAIEAALAGGRSLPERPVRSGYQKAGIVVDLGEYVVRRTITKTGGGSLIVEAKDGTRLSSPQAVLDRMLGDLTFDPFSFLRMEPRRQVEVIAAATGLDQKLAEIEERRRKARENVTAARRLVAEHKATLATLPPARPDDPAEEIPVSDLTARLKAARELEASHETRRRSLADGKRRIADFERQAEDAARLVEDLRARLVEAEESLQHARRRVDHGRAWIAQEESEVAALPNPGVEDIAKGFETLEASNKRARARKARENVEAMLKIATQREADETREVDRLAAERERLVADTAIPVPGLTFTDDGLLLNGLPFAQASSAEKLRASVEIGLFQNPRIRVVLVREGALLDSDGLRSLAEIAARLGAQVWVEQVTDGQKVGIVIEDGRVAGDFTESEPLPGPDFSRQ